VAHGGDPGREAVAGGGGQARHGDHGVDSEVFGELEGSLQDPVVCGALDRVQRVTGGVERLQTQTPRADVLPERSPCAGVVEELGQVGVWRR
jgi:hypothetical protein